MQVPPSGPSLVGPSRRTLLRGTGGAVALSAAVPLLGACAASSGSGGDPKTVTPGSNGLGRGAEDGARWTNSSHCGSR